MTKRKPPIRHKVRSHKREGKPVKSFVRGSGSPRKRLSKIIGKRPKKGNPQRPKPSVTDLASLKAEYAEGLELLEKLDEDISYWEGVQNDPEEYDDPERMDMAKDQISIAEMDFKHNLPLIKELAAKIQSQDPEWEGEDLSYYEDYVR